MVHRGRRSREATLRRSNRRPSQEARARRAAARIVSKNSHRDKRKSENVNVISQGQVLKLLIEKLPDYKTSWLIPGAELFEKGEVISDSRGQGSQQGRRFDE